MICPAGAIGESQVVADYDIAGLFDYQPLPLTLDSLQIKAMQNRPDLRAALQGVTAANSQYALAKANGKQDVTVSGNYSRSSGNNAATFSVAVPLPISAGRRPLPPKLGDFRWRFASGNFAAFERISCGISR